MSPFIPRFLLSTGRIFYGVYAWLAFGFVIVIAVLSALLLPGLQRRRRWVSGAARGFFWLTGIRMRIQGLDRLPPGHCIVVANHASYVDGVILQAVLPARFSIVIKGEVRNVPVAHFMLRRIDSKFVERRVAAGSTRDARTIIKAAAAGESLAFFPEGTFVAQPGLGRFRPGAFRTAIRAELPIVPMVIRGSRDILPARTLLPTHGSLRIDFLEALPATGCANGDSAELAELARQRILSLLDEPDLLLADSSDT